MFATTDPWLPWHRTATPRRWTPSAIATVCAGVLVMTAACTSPAPVPTTAGPTVATGPTPPAPTPTATSSSVTTSTPPAPPPPPGLDHLPAGTVLAVKVDNTTASRPRLGVDRAAAVYVEPVEGGLTRLLAVFSSSAPGGLPGEVGPIRSARESDVTLLAGWGHVALAYSGGSAYTRSLVDGADLTSIPYDASTSGYRRAGDRPAPYNVIGNTAALLARAGAGQTSGDPGFRFGPPSPGGTSATSVSTAWPASSIALRWDAPSGRYLVTSDGRPDVDADGARHAAATVVVQQVPTHLSQNRDVNGVQTPVVDLVGAGPATVLRDGMQWSGQWARPAANAPTVVTAGGQPVAMATGPVWVLLVPNGQAVTVG